MNALPLPGQALLPAAPTTGGAAVLPAVLPAALPRPAGVAAPGRAPTPFSFDRTLQQLLAASAPLDGDGAAAPVAAALPPGVPTGPDGASSTSMPAAMAALPAADGEIGAGTDATAAAQPFDPALASLVPPATMAMAQAAVPVAPAASVAGGRPMTPAATTSIGATGAAAAAAATGAAARDAGLPTLAPAGTAPATATAGTATVVGMAAALPGDAGPVTAQERPAVSLLSAQPQAGTTATALAPATDVAPSARAGDAAQPGKTPSLLQQLGDRVAVQIERGSERVVIRLDPPHRGQIEIHIRQDASGATQVQLSASHGDVVRQLQAIGDSLRQELSQRQGGDVSVQIAQHGRDADGRQRQERDGQQQAQQQPGRALDEQASAADDARFALATERP